MSILVKRESCDTLGLALIKCDTRARERVLVVGAAVFTAICAQVTIPIQPVPVTLQTFAVLLCGIMTGPETRSVEPSALPRSRCLWSACFRWRNFWPQHLGWGYLISYPLAPGLLGGPATKGWDRTFWFMLLAMSAAQALILTLGRPG